MGVVWDSRQEVYDAEARKAAAENYCIACGRIIPEGRHICLACERQNEMQTFGGKVNAAEVVRMCEKIRDIVLESYNCERPIQHAEAIEAHDLLKKIEKEVQK